MAAVKFHMKDGRECTLSEAASPGTIGSVVEAVLAGSNIGYFTITVGDAVTRVDVADIDRVEVIR
jgi:hypothetical protein